MYGRMISHEWKEHLQRAIRLAGSQFELAERMRDAGARDISQSKVSWMIQRGKQISAEDALAVQRATDGKVSAADLRPDLWPSPSHVPA